MVIRRDTAGSRHAQVRNARLAAGLDPPYSCREGQCGSCARELVTGRVELVHNEVLDETDLADGWILACQAIARSDTVTISY